MNGRREVELPDGDLIRVPFGVPSSVIKSLLEEWTTAVDRERVFEAQHVDQLIDADLLADVIAEACPVVLSDLAARQTAERALARLAVMDGVTVVRGPDSKPWKPDDRGGRQEAGPDRRVAGSPGRRVPPWGSDG